MTVEKQDNTAHVWFLNGTDSFAIEIYANGATEPSMSDINPLEVGPLFEVDDSDNRLFGTYRFEVREKDDSSGPVLAEASVELVAGTSYAANFHAGDGGGYQLSVYENDFAPSAATRLELRHAGAAPRIDWRIQPKDGAATSDSTAVRAGALKRGQWQQCTEMPGDSYLLEAVVDGVVVAFLPDLQLEPEKKLVATFVGTPQPATMQSNELRSYWLTQDFSVATGPAGKVTVTPAKPPLNAAGKTAKAAVRTPPEQLAAAKAADSRADPAAGAVDPATGLATASATEPAAAEASPAVCPLPDQPAPGGSAASSGGVTAEAGPPDDAEPGDGPSIVTVEASPAMRDIRVCDPKGRLSDIVIERIEPATKGIRIAKGSVRGAPAAGEPAVVTLAISGELAPGTYRVQLKGRKRHGRRGVAHTVPVTVLPVTVQRLSRRVAGLRATGGLSTAAAERLTALLSEGGAHLSGGDLAEGQAAIDRFLAQIENDRDGAMTPEARAALTRETRALKASLNGA
ncbi:hypothetical protein CKO28_06865 [Rhodovibrio sodomensis]|uniref:FIMAH domain-containing protein n=1 Tax=Rhodovibrio sodomensis TaxID=1088 RepID=A0ABS1DBB8_9PROT|nr:DUF4397 domain-containing protein [Rhodovibrio sodomensis]MBK1667753.1 hypothetical protein [Rhodovibrio sodomensis]